MRTTVHPAPLVIKRSLTARDYSWRLRANDRWPVLASVLVHPEIAKDAGDDLVFAGDINELVSSCIIGCPPDAGYINNIQRKNGSSRFIDGFTGVDNGLVFKCFIDAVKDFFDVFAFKGITHFQRITSNVCFSDIIGQSSAKITRLFYDGRNY
jgi:hypothetical protein